jgi:hypothetical protein
MFKRTIHITYRVARRIVLTVVGLTVALLGLVMLVTPGPGLVGLVAGLGILALEYAWARRWLASVRNGAEYTWNRWGWRRRNGWRRKRKPENEETD